MRKLIEIYEKETSNLFIKRYERVYKIPPCGYVIEDSIETLEITSKEEAVNFMLKYFDGLKLTETKKISEDKGNPEIIISFKLKK
jgi:hypothetical protein